MKKGYIPKDQRKNILFLADDLRLPSGIGTMTRELVIGNSHIYNFVQVGGALSHPDAGKILDISDDVNTEIGISDSSVLIYPYNGYGDPDLTRLLMERHKIDAIVHFTDPRYWLWLYRMSAEIRQTIPIFYYHIWDDLPAPHYNRPYYESCDLLMGISKQSVNISKLVLGEGNYIDLDKSPAPEVIGKSLPKTAYVPHGVNTKHFFPMDRGSVQVQKMRSELFSNQNPDYVIMYNNRNIRRKMASDVILAFKFLCEDLVAMGCSDDVRLVLKTQPLDDNGTDLPAVIGVICPELADKIIFHTDNIPIDQMGILYNCCDTVINIASNEGWGLSSTEALMTGRTLINNVTGGLQDQCRFEDDNGNWIEFDEEFASNHGGKYTKCGAWVKPVFPAAINLQGSIQTPYIFDDRCAVRDVTEAMKYWHGMSAVERDDCGMAGYVWATGPEASLTAEGMCDRFSQSINNTMSNWIAPSRFKLYDTQEQLKKFNNKKSGISI